MSSSSQEKNGVMVILKQPVPECQEKILILFSHHFILHFIFIKLFFKQFFIHVDDIYERH